jgi:hypothetical protein
MNLTSEMIDQRLREHQEWQEEQAMLAIREIVDEMEQYVNYPKRLKRPVRRHCTLLVPSV